MHSYHVAAIHLSVAEEAIRRATGLPAPPKECWGCTDTKFHPERFHLFRECPNRADPDVRQNFAKRLGLFRQNRAAAGYDTSHYNRNDTGPSVHSAIFNPVTWEANGWPNLECALILSEMTTTTASPQTRRDLVLPLLTALARHANTDSANDSNKCRAFHSPLTGLHDPQPPDSTDTSYYGPPTYYNLMITGPLTSEINATLHLNHFQTTAILGRPTFTPVAFSQVLPHLRLPIGPRAENQGTICCLIDTGASLNVGRTDYHQAIARNRPDLVVRFSMLKDEPNGSSPFSIGSVNGDAPPTDIEATITYRTPYIIRGQPVVVTFALGKTIATNSILSFPFLQSIKAALLLENMTCISAVLGDTFKIEYMVPLRADSAPIIPVDAPAAYAATNPSPRTTNNPNTDITTIYLSEAAPNRL